MEFINVWVTVAENTPLCQFAIRTYIEMQNVPDHFHYPRHLQECNDCFWFSMKRVEKGSFDVWSVRQGVDHGLLASDRK